MAVTAKLQAAFPENLGGGNTSGEGPMDLLSDTLKVMLVTASASPSQTTWTVKADVTNEVGSGNGYTTGGETLASKTWAVSSLVTTFDAADQVWTTTTFSHQHAFGYDDTPTSPADPLIFWIDTGGTQTTSGTNLTYQWNASGIWTITVA